MENDTTRQRAVSLFGQGHNCAQAVLLAVTEQLDLVIPEQVAGAFGGGMGRTGQTCGAVTGALMALGLGWSDGKPQGVSEAARDFMEQFTRQYGSTDCEDLIKGRFATGTTPQTYCTKTKKRLCSELVGYAAETAGGMVDS